MPPLEISPCSTPDRTSSRPLIIDFNAPESVPVIAPESCTNTTSRLSGQGINNTELLHKQRQEAGAEVVNHVPKTISGQPSVNDQVSSSQLVPDQFIQVFQRDQPVVHSTLPNVLPTAVDTRYVIQSVNY